MKMFRPLQQVQANLTYGYISGSAGDTITVTDSSGNVVASNEATPHLEMWFAVPRA